MRRRLLVLLVLGALALFSVALAACRQSEGALGQALGYLPKDSPFVLSVDTDLDSDQYRAAQRLLRRVPLGGQLQRSLEGEIEDHGQGVNFRRDIRPLLGEPLVVGASDPASFARGGEANVVGAIKVSDPDKLKGLLERESGGGDGEHGGATLYRGERGGSYAVTDDVLVFASERRRLEQALDGEGGDDRLDEQDFEDGLEGLSGDALMRVYGNLGALVRSDSSTPTARRIPWVRALRTLGLTARATSDGVEVDYRVRTDGADLTDQDLPLAPGGPSPRVAGLPGEIAFAVRDPAHLARFGERAAQAADPQGFGQFQAVRRQLEARLRVDLERDVLDQLSGDASVSVPVHGGFAVRAELKDPRAFERTLEKLADGLPRIAGQAGGRRFQVRKPAGGDGLYTVVGADGDRVFLGVVNRVLVAASTPARARRMAAASPRRVPGAQGSLASMTDARQVADQVLRRMAPELGLGGLFGGRLVTGALGQTTGSMSSERDGLRGRSKLEIR